MSTDVRFNAPSSKPSEPIIRGPDSKVLPEFSNWKQSIVASHVFQIQPVKFMHENGGRFPESHEESSKIVNKSDLDKVLNFIGERDSQPVRIPGSNVTTSSDIATNSILKESLIGGMILYLAKREPTVLSNMITPDNAGWQSAIVDPFTGFNPVNLNPLFLPPIGIIQMAERGYFLSLILLLDHR